MTKQSLLQFPCQFPLKVIGHNKDTIETTILQILQRHFTDISTISISSRLSQDSKYRSFTLQLTPTSQAHLDAIYIDFTSCTDIIMVL